MSDKFVNPFSKKNEAEILEIERGRQRKEQEQRQAIVDLANSLPRKIDGTKPNYSIDSNGKIIGGKYKRKSRKSKKNKRTRKSRKNKRTRK